MKASGYVFLDNDVPEWSACPETKVKVGPIQSTRTGLDHLLKARLLNGRCWADNTTQLNIIDKKNTKRKKERNKQEIQGECQPKIAQRTALRCCSELTVKGSDRWKMVGSSLEYQLNICNTKITNINSLSWYAIWSISTQKQEQKTVQSLRYLASCL